MLKKIGVALLFGMLSWSVFAMEYYVVVPLKGRVEHAGGIAVVLHQGVPPVGQVGRPYAYDFKQYLSVTGDPGYTGRGVRWSGPQGNLPAGLTLSSTTGVLSGIPVAEGSSEVTVTATYKTKSGEQRYLVVVANARSPLAQFSDYRAWSDGTFASSCEGYRRPLDSYSYSGPTGDGVYRIKPNEGLTLDVYCDMTTNGGGWTLVRRAKAGPAWPAVNDNAAGTVAYGSYVPSPRVAATFSLAYSTFAYADMLFITGDGAKWVAAPRSSVATITSNCGTPVPVLASHLSPAAYSVAWCLRASATEDPWISASDHGANSTNYAADTDTVSMLYGEGSFIGWSYWLSNRDGANVFVR